MFAVEICTHVDRSRYEPRIVFSYDGPGPLPGILRDRGIPFANLRRSRFTQFFEPWRTALVLKSLGIDILHVHHAPFLKAIYRSARLAGIKRIVFTEHARFSISRSPGLQRFCRTIPSKAVFTVVSNDLKRYFVEEIGIADSDIRVVYNGVDTTRFAPDPCDGTLLDALPAGFPAPVILTVGRLAEAKDHDTLLSAIALLRDRGVRAGLAVVGDGALRPEIEHGIARRGLEDRVCMLGRRSDTHKLLRGASVFVLSSKREGLPLAIIEAMATGLPVVSTNVGGIPELITAGHDGLLVAPGEPSVLADTLALLCREPESARALGRNARATAEDRFSIKSIAAAYEGIYCMRKDASR